MLNCLICGHVPEKFLSLGKTALANSFLKSKDMKEEFFPLEVCFCKNCYHVQLTDIISPEIMFKDYVYVSSTSEALRNHFSDLANYVRSKIPITKNDLIIDIGSNDGTLLKQFKKLGSRVYGVEPATNISEIANKEGIDTCNEFFNLETAKKIKKENGSAKIITGTNVFAHQPSYESFMEGILELLDENGIFVVEVPYLPNLITGLEFDTIYHEHVSYFALRPLEKLFNKFGLEIFDVSEHKIHGGTIRVIGKVGKESLPEDNKFIQLEKNMKLDSIDTFIKFADNIKKIRSQLVLLLNELKNQNKKIAGYGAAAKGNTLLSYCDIKGDLIDFIVDKNPLKQNLFTPGTKIPVFDPEKLKQDFPNYLLILAWNFADEIINQQKEFRAKGGKFIIPLPQPKVIE